MGLGSQFYCQRFGKACHVRGVFSFHHHDHAFEVFKLFAVVFILFDIRQTLGYQIAPAGFKSEFFCGHPQREDG